MQYVKDDMDEQFRKAAENYPLDTSGADWSKVQKGLEGPAEVVVSKKSGNTRLLWLLLLLPMALICNRYQNRSGSEQEVAGTREYEMDKARRENQPLKEEEFTPGTTRKNTHDLQEQNPGGSSSSVSTVPGSKDQQVPVAGQPVEMKNGTTSKKPVTEKVFVAQSKQAASRNDKRPTPYQPDGLPGKEPEGIAPLESTTTSTVFYTSMIPQSEREAFRINPVSASQRKIVSGEIPSPSKLATARDKRFYAGIMGGADVTTIKFQKIENAGYDFGVIAGYELNKRLSVEAGVFLDKKFYYTDGKYFNTSKIYMPPNSKITEVSGDCKMWEIPVSLRYNFPSQKRSAWFATAGMTSYIMKREEYDYRYYYGSTGVYAWHNRYYTNSSTNLFSALHFSGGYTRPLGKWADLRIEPYLKIPVSNMGYGELPLLSTGIHIGLTKKLF